MKTLSIETEKLLRKFIKLDNQSKNKPVSYRCFSIEQNDINKISNSNGAIKVNYSNVNNKGAIDIGSSDAYNKLIRENIKLFELIKNDLLVQNLCPFDKTHKESEAFAETVREFKFMNDISTNGFIYGFFLTEKGRYYFKNRKSKTIRHILWDYIVPLSIAVCTLIFTLLTLLKTFNKI